MGKFIDKNALIGDDYRAVILCEYTHDLSLIKQLIEIAEKAVSLKKPSDTWTSDGMCYLFAKSIVSYAKMAYDNMILGHFDATNMIVRTIIENNVCLDIMQRYEKEELWKYYLVQSYRNSIMCSGKELEADELNFLNKIYSDYGIENEFIEKSKKKDAKRPYAYIDKNYGWTYKINKNFTFSGLCELVDKREYNDFKMMSMYSHGTAIHLKINGSVSMDNIMSMISSIYIGLYRLVTMYCWNEVDVEFDDVTEEIEVIIYDYLDINSEQ